MRRQRSHLTIQQALVLLEPLFLMILREVDTLQALPVLANIDAPPEVASVSEATTLHGGGAGPSSVLEAGVHHV